MGDPTIESASRRRRDVDRVRHSSRAPRLTTRAGDRLPRRSARHEAPARGVPLRPSVFRQAPTLEAARAPTRLAMSRRRDAAVDLAIGRGVGARSVEHTRRHRGAPVRGDAHSQCARHQAQGRIRRVRICAPHRRETKILTATLLDHRDEGRARPGPRRDASISPRFADEISHARPPRPRAQRRRNDSTHLKPPTTRQRRVSTLAAMGLVEETRVAAISLIVPATHRPSTQPSTARRGGGGGS